MSVKPGQARPNRDRVCDRETLYGSIMELYRSERPQELHCSNGQILLLEVETLLVPKYITVSCLTLEPNGWRTEEWRVDAFRKGPLAFEGLKQVKRMVRLCCDDNGYLDAERTQFLMEGIAYQEHLYFLEEGPAGEHDVRCGVVNEQVLLEIGSIMRRGQQAAQA